MWRRPGMSGSFAIVLAYASSRLTDDLRQPTLRDPPEGSKAPDSGWLTLFDLVAARALDLSLTESAPLTPSPSLTRAVFARMMELRVIRAAGEAKSDEVLGRSIYERAVWSSDGDFPTGHDLATALRRHAFGSARGESVQLEQAEIWLRLAVSELEGYARHLLRGTPATELALAHFVRLLPNLLRTASVAAVRRALWLHLRGPQVAAMPTPQEDAPNAFAEQMVARVFATARRMEGRDDNLQFTPVDGAPVPLMRRVFLTEACAIGLRYWTRPPTLSVLNQEASAHGYHRRFQPSPRG